MQKGFSKGGSQPLQLSPNFAEEVMELELDVELNQKVNIQQVNRLIELYTSAVEYYESIKSNKFIIFKNKIINLMLKPSVTRLTETDSLDTKRNLVSSLAPEDKDAGESKRQTLDFNLQIQSKEHQLSARKMMVGTDTKLQNVQRKINNEISKQQLKIEERLRMRKGKAEVASLGSTESDPKQKQAREKDELFSFETILQSQPVVEQKQFEEKISTLLQEPQTCKQTLLQTKPTESIVINPLPIKEQKKRPKKQVLTLKPNQKPSTLPDQYSIPF